MPYFSHIKLRKEFTRVKVRNSYAKLMGLDIGRKYIGVSLSDNDAKLAIVIISIHLSLLKHSKSILLATPSPAMTTRLIDNSISNYGVSSIAQRQKDWS